ncbi:MAG: hypothetical protein QOI63_129 [Thermoplasmata archaeon]|nr:hypothetical protein [Thermoplasmata archaeon]
MHRIVTSIGLIAAIMTFGFSAEAYHLTGNATGGGFSTYNWGPHIGVSNTVVGNGPGQTPDPTGPLCVLLQNPALGVAGAILHATLCDPTTNTVTGLTGGEALSGFILCEQEDASDEVIGGFALTGVSVNGFGGLCYMSVGCSAGATLQATGGRSNGNYKDYSVAATCKAWVPGGPNFLPAPASGTAANLVKITMCPKSTVAVPPTCVGAARVTFSAQINGVSCRNPAAVRVDYDDVFTYEVADGHVAGFATTDPANGDLGTYDVALGVRGTTAEQCATGQPWWQSGAALPAPPPAEPQTCAEWVHLLVSGVLERHFDQCVGDSGAMPCTPDAANPNLGNGLYVFHCYYGGAFCDPHTVTNRADLWNGQVPAYAKAEVYCAGLGPIAPVTDSTSNPGTPGGLTSSGMKTTGAYECRLTFNVVANSNGQYDAQGYCQG